jgi:hypothetical protein
MKITHSFLTPFIVLCFALLPSAQAVVPAPDGGYPGGNTAEGQAALLSLTTGGFNTAVGFLSLRSDASGGFNTALGAGTLLANTGDTNTATGVGALLSNTIGFSNTANGAFALFNNTVAGSNTATGAYALYSNDGGVGNVATGGGALSSNISGFGNTGIGTGALSNSENGNFNVAVGANAGSGVITASHVICIGVAGNDVANSCYIDNIFGATSSGGTAVFVNMNGRLGTMTSSRRFKEEIKPMERTSEALLALKPVTFRYKKAIDPAGKSQFGLVAEEVEKVNPDLVVRDKEGKPYSVRYDQVNAMLLNEFLKEHRKVQEQEASIKQLKSTVSKQEAAIAQQRQGMEAMMARLNEQAAQIRRVSAQIDPDRPAPQQVALKAP